MQRILLLLKEKPIPPRDFDSILKKNKKIKFTIPLYLKIGNMFE